MMLQQKKSIFLLLFFYNKRMIGCQRQDSLLDSEITVGKRRNDYEIGNIDGSAG